MWHFCDAIKFFTNIFYEKIESFESLDDRLGLNDLLLMDDCLDIDETEDRIL